MDSNLLHQALADLSMTNIRFFETIGSTNDEAMAWAEGGAPDFSLVIANQQTHGRGRMGRHWVTNPGGSLAISLILRPSSDEMGFMGLFSPLGGLGVACALEKIGLPALVKWPNDVLVRRKKLCGILAEAVWNGSQLRGLVLGIGVNVAPESVPPPDEVMFPATCVENELGQQVDRVDLLHEVMAQLMVWRDQLGKPAFMAAWQAHLAFRDEMVEVHPPGGTAVAGLLVGVDVGGNLCLRLENGTETNVAAGDVHLRPEASS